MSSLNSAPVTIRFFLPAKKLRPYISTYYLTEVRPEDEERAADWLHPEWANLRIIDGVLPMGGIGNEYPHTAPRFSIVGPTRSYNRIWCLEEFEVWGVPC